MPWRPLVHLISTATLALGLVACAEEAHDDAHDSDAEICEHMADGPSVPVVASSTPARGELPDVSAPHTRHDIGLVADTGSGFVGHVGFAADEATDYIIATDREVTLTVTGPDDAEIAAEETVANPSCAEITHHVFELAVGTSILSFTSATGDPVRVVIEEAAHDDHAE